MSTDVSRVYQFLAKFGDWQSVADTNSDGAILKAEFRTFMEDNFEWNGEDASAQNDLINDFWKKIDTKQSGGIKGTRLVNKNALDSSELEAMDKKIALYEILNNFTSNLSAPSVVSDSANWKKSVSAGLAALVDKYTGSEEELLAYLEEQSPLIESKATADYCANEYLNSEMASIVKDYGYAYADDTTLQGMIDTYIQNISGEADANEIQQTVINIIDAYLATAGLKEDNAFDLSQYGYSTSSTSALNDLQKSVLTKNLTSALQEGDLKEDYENNTDLFTTAIESYIGSLKFGDFETVSADVLNSFKASDEYKSVEKNLQVKDLFSSDDFYNALVTNFSESLANTIFNDGKYLAVMKEIQEEALTKAQNGDFDGDGGALDKAAVTSWIIDQISSRLAEFYPNGFGDMKLDELSTMYDKLAEAADKTSETDTDAALIAHRDAAIKYCDALAARSSKFKEIVVNTFGSENYENEINKLYPTEIRNKINELKELANELGDATELTLASSTWAGISSENAIDLESSKTSAIKFIDDIIQEYTDKYNRSGGARKISAKFKLKDIQDSIQSIFGSSDYAAVIKSLDEESLLAKMKQFNSISPVSSNPWSPVESGNNSTSQITVLQGSSTQFTIKPAFNDADGNAKTITTDRIEYKLSNSSIASINKSTGEVTINGSTAGDYTLTISIMVDGHEVGKNTVTIHCQSIENAISNIGKDAWGGSSGHLEVFGVSGVSTSSQVTSANFGLLYDSNAVIMLHRDNNNDNSTGTVRTRLNELCAYIVNALSSIGLDKDKLKTASEQVLNNLMNGYAQKGSSDDDTEGVALGNRVAGKIQSGELTGVVKFTDYKRVDYQVNMVSFKEVVDLILAAYGA